MLDEISHAQLFDRRRMNGLKLDVKKEPDDFVVSRAQLSIESLH